VEYTISVKPLGLEVTVQGEQDLLTCLKDAGIGIESICGGKGTCGKCRIHLLEGEATPPTQDERKHISEGKLREGGRLACKVKPLSDLVIYIPASSLTHDQRLQLAAELEVAGQDPAVTAVDVEVDVPTAAGDPGSDLLRLIDALPATDASEGYHADPYCIRELPPLLRREKGSIRAFIRGGELLAAASRDRPALGLAVDLGSTKVALFLYDLSRGGLLRSHGFLNPQISFGEDIVSRIQYAIEGDENSGRLMRLVIENINSNLACLFDAPGYSPTDIYEMVLVGNTAMHHLFLGLPVEQLGRSPYLPATDLPLEIKGRDLGMEFNPAAVIYLPPPIAGFVGSDHLAAITAVRLRERPGPCLLLDIGTNTEVALQVEGRIYCCSCASGPAFEGGCISQGMRAGEGAIEQVSINPQSGEPEVWVIGEAPPSGLCGSGVLGAVSAMKEAGVIDGSGRMKEDHRLVQRRNGELVFYIVAPGDGDEEGVAVTQADIREVQKANGAIRTGVDVLLSEAGIAPGDVREVLLAGAFGSYIDPAGILSIALLPPIDLGRIHQVGNAAGAGARGMLLSSSLRQQAVELSRHLNYVELATYPNLSRLFAANMFLSEEESINTKKRFKLL
jgi:uncharacterized 2Fe-2S/4Fe-4S cluster protein (DUF4445 family)